MSRNSLIASVLGIFLSASAFGKPPAPATTTTPAVTAPPAPALYTLTNGKLICPSGTIDLCATFPHAPPAPPAPPVVPAAVVPTTPHGTPRIDALEAWKIEMEAWRIEMDAWKADVDRRLAELDLPPMTTNNTVINNTTTNVTNTNETNNTTVEGDGAKFGGYAEVASVRQRELDGVTGPDMMDWGAGAQLRFGDSEGAFASLQAGFLGGTASTIGWEGNLTIGGGVNGWLELGGYAEFYEYEVKGPRNGHSAFIKAKYYGQRDGVSVSVSPLNSDRLLFTGRAGIDLFYGRAESPATGSLRDWSPSVSFGITVFPKFGGGSETTTSHSSDTHTDTHTDTSTSRSTSGGSSDTTITPPAPDPDELLTIPDRADPPEVPVSHFVEPPPIVIDRKAHPEDVITPAHPPQ